MIVEQKQSYDSEVELKWWPSSSDGKSRLKFAQCYGLDGEIAVIPVSEPARGCSYLLSIVSWQFT